MLERKAQVVGVFTQTREQARSNADWGDLSPLCQMYRVPVFHFRKISDPETVEKIRDLKPEIIFVLGLSQLLPPNFLHIPPMGVIGSHPALLPENRGRHPLVWALVKGLKKSGLTLFYIDEGVDSGDIALAGSFPLRSPILPKIYTRRSSSWEPRCGTDRKTGKRRDGLDSPRSPQSDLSAKKK